jgi:hypothetical protein
VDELAVVRQVVRGGDDQARIVDTFDEGGLPDLLGVALLSVGGDVDLAALVIEEHLAAGGSTHARPGERQVELTRVDQRRRLDHQRQRRRIVAELVGVGVEAAGVALLLVERVQR